MINTAVCGIGRTGGEVIRELLKSDHFRLSAAFCSPNSQKAGKDVGTLLHLKEAGVKATQITQADQVFSSTETNVFIDFSNPISTKTLLLACRKKNIPGVICTTGFTAAELAELSNFTEENHLGVVFAPNVTLGINVLIAALKLVSHALPDFDYRITETHHNKKMDKPSGTAKIIARTLERDLHMPADRHIPIHSLRAGGYVGIHEVLVASDCERLSITHESFSRKAFVQGALYAAKFIIGKTGWYSMEDVVDVHSLLTDPEQAVS
jgi:4-hydroxy-tetrahydrodipicolinate reductase